MSLSDLVDTFNEVFVHEHHFSFRPFVLKNNRVSGLFGPLRIDSVFSPIRKASKPTDIVGHDAHIEVAVNNNPLLDENEIGDLLTDSAAYHSNLESIISFDRLSRTVHVLNYLTLLPVYRLLFLEVDPRHILGVKKDHGVYFQEFIEKAGLETQNVAVMLTVYDQYVRYYPSLLAGLDAYRRHGYQIALKFDSFLKNDASFDLIGQFFPDYVSLSARALEPQAGRLLEDTLGRLIALANSVNSRTLLQQIDHKKNDLLARSLSFDLVEGSYYRSIPHDYRITPEQSGRHA